jgi:hypothetical protein
MNTNWERQPDLPRNPGNSMDELDLKIQLIRVSDTLSELHDLFENFAPVWYTEHHRKKVESALRLAKGL